MWQLDGVDVESERLRIVANKRIHDYYVYKLIKLYNRKHYEDAALLAELIGFLAWRIPCGKYHCSETELVLNGIGNNLYGAGSELNDIPLNSCEAFSKRRVLHVISISYQIGGHTRAVERMISNSSDHSVGSVVITNHEGVVPEWLKESIQASGGWLKILDRDSTLLSRAITLRSITKIWADLVILHIHPNDPVANLAYSCGTDTPVVFFNHADHVFWYGATISDTVAQIRPAGKILSESRRGVINSLYLPIPLELSVKKDIQDAKTKLGFCENDTVLFSVASAYKYKNIGPISFLAIHEKIIQKYDNVKLLVVGPENSGVWREYHDKTGGKITAVGRQNDISQYYACADIYVDSYPFASLTSLLEAGLHGKPAIGLYNSASPVISCDDLSLNKSHIAHAETPEVYELKLSRLINDIELRRTTGETLKQEIIDDHTGDGWLEYWNKIVAVKKNNRYVSFNPEQITYDDILLSMQCSAIGYWRVVGEETSSSMRKFGINIKSQMLIDWLLKRNLFCNMRIPSKYFISQRVVTGFKNMFQIS